VRPASTTVALPRWAIGLLVGSCAVCLVAVAFLLGRVTAPAPPAAGSADVAGQAVSTGSGEESRPDRDSIPPGSSETSRDVLPFRAPEAGDAAGQGIAPPPLASAGSAAGADPDAVAVAAYFTRMDALAALATAAQDPQALARNVLDQALSGNIDGIENLIATQRTLQTRMVEVLPPRSCSEHHQRSVRLIGRAIALLERTRDAIAGKNPSDLATMATEGRAIEEEARATDALANDLRRAAGLPPVP